MKLLKSAVVAVSLALSMGSFSTTAVACEDGRTCYGPEQAIDITLGKIAEAMKAINDGADAASVEALIKEATDSQKEINANDKVAGKRQRANGHLKKAKKAVGKGDMVKATEHLEAGEKAFEGLKKYL